MPVDIIRLGGRTADPLFILRTRLFGKDLAWATHSSFGRFMRLRVRRVRIQLQEDARRSYLKERRYEGVRKEALEPPGDIWAGGRHPNYFTAGFRPAAIRIYLGNDLVRPITLESSRVDEP